MKPIHYDKFQYLYPPRPDVKISSDKLDSYDNGQWLAQPKYNGCCAIVFLNETDTVIMNRHREILTNVKNDIDLSQVYRGNGYHVLTGEYLNKNKKGENGLSFNHKFIIWDILVHDGMYLIGSTVEERLNLLELLYPCNRISVGEEFEIYNHLCCTNFKNIYKAPTYLHGFKQLYDEISETDLYEGLVLKRKDAKLNYGYSEKNNHDYMVKVRKETKNYKF